MDKLKEDNFKSTILESELPVLVDFSATWCMPCKATGKILEELSACYAGRIKILNCDVEECAEITSKYGIISVPTLLFFDKGNLTPVDKIVGAAPRNEIIEKIEQHI